MIGIRITETTPDPFMDTEEIREIAKMAGDAEREKIIAWLRSEAIEAEDDPRNALPSSAARQLADAIERLDHKKTGS